MKEIDIENEVRAIIVRRVDRGQVAVATWITQAVIRKHTDIRGADADWYQVCAYNHVRSIVQKCVSRYKLSPSVVADEQLLLPGFKRLQKAYLTERDKEQVVVPISQMTGDELKQKAIELRRMGDGCYEHADELDRYIEKLAAAV